MRLTEKSLDELVRLLCTREIAMNVPEPDLSISREFLGSDGAGGSFCIQEFVPPSSSKYIVAHFRHASTLSSGSKGAKDNDDDDDEEERRAAPCRRVEHSLDFHAGLFSFSTRAWSLKNQHMIRDTAEEDKHLYDKDDDPVDAKLQARVQVLLQHLVTHLHVFFGLQSLELTVEFAHEQSRDRLYLISAQRIQVQQISHTRANDQHHPGSSALKTRLKPGGKRSKQRPEVSNNLMRRDELTSELLLPTGKHQQQQQPPSPTHANYRVCRQCRSATDVDLAKELMRKQTMLRGVLAKYQSVQEQHAATHIHNEELQELLERQQRTIYELQRELDRVRSAFQEKDVQALELKLENSDLQVQLVNTVEELQAVNLQVEHAEQRVLEAEALQKQKSSLDRENEDAWQTLPQWECCNAHLEQQFSQLQRELERNQQTLRKLQTKYEEVRADRDELRFQWRFVYRKLVDIKEPGVAPPQRIAGGYRSYPVPSDANVRDVVKWLVNYDAKRVLIEVQKKKTVGKRLRLKLELMRVLGSPKKRKSTLATTSSAASSPSPRLRSRSPSIRAPTMCSKSRAITILEPEAGASPPSTSPVRRSCRQLGSTPPKMTLVQEALARREQRKLSQDQQTNNRGHV